MVTKISFDFQAALFKWRKVLSQQQRFNKGEHANSVDYGGR